MPVALYAISHLETLKVLAIVSFEKRNLVDKQAWEQLRKELIGDKLVLDLGAHALGPIAIPAAQLAVDEIDLAGGDPKDIYDDPFAYELAAQGTTQVAPGDGTPKKLFRLSTSLPVTLTTAGVLTLTIAPPSMAYVVFEGSPPEPRPVTGTPGTPKPETFQVATSLSSTQAYAVLALATGYPAVATMVKPQ